MTLTIKPQSGTEAARVYERLFEPGGPLSDIPDCPERWLFVDAETGIPFPGVAEHFLIAEQVWDPDLIPDIGDEPEKYWGRSQRDQDLTSAVAQLGIVEAYRRWCGKMEPKIGNRHESIMVSCPIPGHEDRNPSAWLNSDKNLGNCALCGGFDIWDLLAIHMGMPWPSYKTSNFVEVKERMAQELGLALVTSGGMEFVRPLPNPQPSEALVSSPAPNVVETPENTPVEAVNTEIQTEIHQTPDTSTETYETSRSEPMGTGSFTGIPIDWRNLLNPNDSTFLHEWMSAQQKSDLPKEYYLWIGLVGLGMTVGNNVQMDDATPVRANLLVCLLGPSGVGKSRAISPMITLLDELGGVERTDPESAQAIHRRLLKQTIDANGSDVVAAHEPVKYLAYIDEFSSLIARQARSSSTIKQAFMQLYDSASPWGYDAKIDPLERAKDHFVSVLTTSQPAVLGSLLDRNDANSGFLNRWVYASGIVPPPRSLITDNPLDIPFFVKLLRKIRTWSETVTEPLQFETQAFQKWDKFFHKNLAKFRDGSFDGPPIFTRSELLLKKLMLLFAIDGRRKWISVADVDRALALWPYIEKGYQFISKETTETAEVKIAATMEEAILATLNKYGQLPTGRIQRELGGAKINRLGGRAAYRRALAILVDTGSIEQVRSTRTMIYMLPAPG